MRRPPRVRLPRNSPRRDGPETVLIVQLNTRLQNIKKISCIDEPAGLHQALVNNGFLVLPDCLEKGFLKFFKGYLDDAIQFST